MSRNRGRSARLSAMSFGLALAVSALAGARAEEGAPETMTVETAQGLVKGTVESGIAAFRGLPFAAPPVGELRWRPPAPPAPFEGTFDASAFGPVCPQPVRPDRRFEYADDAMSEDCLTLNVWAPVDAKDLPVMVWIHGGAFRIGSGSLPFYDGSRLAPDGVVVVTINYRLGRFGFFAHPALTAESEDGRLGNYAIMDAIAALGWVQENITAFGGDPDEVTIFGESAGGAAVSVLMTSPEASGLFARAISQSGGGMTDFIGLRTGAGGRPSAEALGIAFATSAGLAGAEASAAELRALPMETVLGGRSLRDPVPAGPFVDGTVVVGDVGVRFARGLQHKVPFLAGANSFEVSVITELGGDPMALMEGSGIDLAAARAAYAADSGGEDARMAQLFAGDQRFVAGARHMAASMEPIGAPAYLYFMSYVPEGRRATLPGAPHGMDVPFVWRSVKAGEGPAGAPYTEADEAMSAVMSGYWINFAKTGNPNADGLPLWRTYTQRRPVTQVLGDEVRGEQAWLKGRLDLHQARYDSLKGLAPR